MKEGNYPQTLRFLEQLLVIVVQCVKYKSILVSDFRKVSEYLINRYVFIKKPKFQ